MTAWPAADGIDAHDALTMQNLIGLWGRWYYIEYTPEGRYRATRPDGYVLPEADTPEGLRFAIMADYSRWGIR